MEAESAAALMRQPLPTSKAVRNASISLRMSDLLCGSGDSITYPRLVGLRRRGLRNGNWRHLDSGQKALFQCALWVAKARGRISNMKLIVEILRVALRLMESVRGQIMRTGRNRSTTMLQTFSKPSGVFSWAPRVKEWLTETSFVWYLGVLEVNP